MDKGQICFKVFGYPDFDMARQMNKKEIEASKKEESKKDADKLKQTAKIESK